MTCFKLKATEVAVDKWKMWGHGSRNWNDVSPEWGFTFCLFVFIFYKKAFCSSTTHWAAQLSGTYSNIAQVYPPYELQIYEKHKFHFGAEGCKIRSSSPCGIYGGQSGLGANTSKDSQVPSHSFTWPSVFIKVCDSPPTGTVSQTDP